MNQYHMDQKPLLAGNRFGARIRKRKHFPDFANKFNFVN